VRQAEMSVKEKEEWNTGEGIRKWQRCFDCGQFFHGAVQLALGWACWKTYLGRPENDEIRCDALMVLAPALATQKSNSPEARMVNEAAVDTYQRVCPWDECRILMTRGNLVHCYKAIGQHDEAIKLERAIYAAFKSMSDSRGDAASASLQITAALSLAHSLGEQGEYAEAVSLLRKSLRLARTGGIFYWSCIRVPEIKRRSRRVPHIHLTSALLFLTSKCGSRFGPFGPAAAPVNAFQAQ